MSLLRSRLHCGDKVSRVCAPTFPWRIQENPGKIWFWGLGGSGRYFYNVNLRKEWLQSSVESFFLIWEQTLLGLTWVDLNNLPYLWF